nr:gustatory receptor 21 [Papilio glaucus]
MSFPNVHIDNYVNDISKPAIDILSKIYTIANSLIGINRITVAFKVKGLYMVIAFLCSFLINIIITFLMLSSLLETVSSFVVFNIAQYLVCSVVAVTSRGNLQKFYNELYAFDKDIKTKLPTNFKAKINFTLAILTFSFICIQPMLIYILRPVSNTNLVMVTIDLSNMLELFYYGHLFILLETRLKSIRVILVTCFPHENQIYCLRESEFINFDDEAFCKLITRNPDVEIKKLSLLYYKSIKAYDFLYAAIKWQMLFILATSFVSLLKLFDLVALQITNNEFILKNAIFSIGLTVIRLVPLMVPSVFGERVHNEVSLLKTALNSRINNVFDTTSCRFARLFIDLLEVRSLTFSVFRMIVINTTFPSKFIGLIVTYVVIWLQFQKVIDFAKLKI